MGASLFKSNSLDFAVLPSENIEGPLGLGYPDDKSLNKVEEETLIPALCMQEVRKNNCAKEWSELAACSQKWHWASVALCRRKFDSAMVCNKQYLTDPEFQEKMKNHYLELRATYRATGVEPKF